MSQKHICEISLRWILAARRCRDLHKYNMYVINRNIHPEVLGDSAGDFGHNGASLEWTLKQAKRIDEIGLREWLKTKDACGYGHKFKMDLVGLLK